MVCQEALAGYEELKSGLEDAGLTLSVSKTGFLTSSIECKKQLNLTRREEQPRAQDLLKDLGLDSSGGRRRRIGTQQQRLLKRRGRQSKLLHTNSDPDRSGSESGRRRCEQQLAMALKHRALRHRGFVC